MFIMLFRVHIQYQQRYPSVSRSQKGPGIGSYANKFFRFKKSNQMRNIIYAINTTLDGVCDHTKFNPDEEIMEYFTHLTRDADTFLYGRKTYQLMIPYWPDIAKDHSGQRKVEIEYADAFVAVENIVVFSRTLDKAEGKNTRIVRTNLHDEILALKQGQGKNILTGGVTIPSQLAELGLIDEYRFIVHPIVVGEGRRLFEGIDLQEKLQLKLVESTVFKSGAVVLRYLKQ
jgi:dihydrofolate reductase